MVFPERILTLGLSDCWDPNENDKFLEGVPALIEIEREMLSGEVYSMPVVGVPTSGRFKIGLKPSKDNDEEAGDAWVSHPSSPLKFGEDFEFIVGDQT